MSNKLIIGVQKIPVFFKEVGDELKRVNWSTRKELIGAAVIVVVVCAFLTVYVSLVDAVLSKALQILSK